MTPTQIALQLALLVVYAGAGWLVRHAQGGQASTPAAPGLGDHAWEEFESQIVSSIKAKVREIFRGPPPAGGAPA